MPTANVVGVEPQWWQCGYYCSACAVCAFFTGIVALSGFIGILAIGGT